MLDMWMKMPETAMPDFSGLQAVVLGGASVSAGFREKAAKKTSRFRWD